MFKKIVILGLLVLLVAYAGAEVWVNNYAESAITRKLKEDHPEAAKVTARVSIPLLASLLANGRIRRVGVSADHVRVAKVPPPVALITGQDAIFASNVNVELAGVKVDRDALLGQKQLRVASIDHLDITTEISQDEASKVLKILPDLDIGFEFLKDTVRVRVGRTTISGTLDVNGGTLRFIPGSQTGLGVPNLDPVLELNSLIFARCTSNLTVQLVEGKLKVRCQQDNPPLATR